MTFDSQEVLRRFHLALLREIRGSNPEYLNSPFTVAEIYQNLVPYRTHRDELGVEMNADYEHALLRLLAGEGDYLTIESRSARQEIREELDSPNPNTGLYRDFAAADVRLNPEKVDEGLGEDSTDRLPGAEEPAEEGDSPDAEPSEEQAGGEVVRGGDPVEVSEVASLSSVADEIEANDETTAEEGPGDSPEEGVDVAATEIGVFTPDNCPWCREDLPNRPSMKFCPFCGSDVRLRPCPDCGEELEIKWRFCIACGTEVA